MATLVDSLNQTVVDSLGNTVVDSQPDNSTSAGAGSSMSTPNVILTELDGALGVLPPESGKPLVVFGPADAGPYDTPVAFGRESDVTATFGAGPAVEALCYWIANYQRPGVICRTHATTNGTYGTIVAGATGTSAVSLDSSTHPNDDYEAEIVVANGGTVGTAGITVRWSLDGGRSGLADGDPVTSLGASNSFIFPSSGGVRVQFAAGTLVAGDTFSFRCNAPTFNGSDLTTAMEGLRVSAYNWDVAYAAGIVDATTFAAIESGFSTMRAVNKRRTWVGNTRIRNQTGETRAQYQTALQGIFGSLASVYGSLYAGDAKIYSGVTGRRYRRPAAFAAAAREAWLEVEQNAAMIDWGPLPGVQLAELNNPDCHDEFLYPGLDDLRFATLRTWASRSGAYVTDPRIFCSAGSDFQITPYRKVMNLFESTLIEYLEHRLQKPIRVDANTGYIFGPDASEIERGAYAQIDAVLGSGPKISGRGFRVSRTDNLLATRLMLCDVSVIPLAYPRQINLTTSFVNPARNLVAV